MRKRAIHRTTSRAAAASRCCLRLSIESIVNVRDYFLRHTVPVAVVGVVLVGECYHGGVQLHLLLILFTIELLLLLLVLLHASYLHPQPILAPLFQRIEMRGEGLTLAGRRKVSAAHVVLQNIAGLAARWLLVLQLLLLLFGAMELVQGNQEVVYHCLRGVSQVAGLHRVGGTAAGRGGIPKLRGRGFYLFSCTSTQQDKETETWNEQQESIHERSAVLGSLLFANYAVDIN